MKTFAIMNLGCKVNQYESEYISNLLIKNNYIKKDFNDICDIYIINTCTVTNNSDSKSKKYIRSAIKKNKDACIIAIGCFIEANKDYYENGLDIVIGNKNKSKILDYINEYYTNKEFLNKTYKNDLKYFDDMYLEKFETKTRAFVKIQDGCENYCSFCIIPFVRGRLRSKEFDTVIDEIKDLTDNNFKEIVLTGIHTGSYGIDLNIKFSSLLKEILKIEKLKRLRISSIEITELDDEFLTLLESNEKLVDHLHIPIQSGSNKILKLMNRKYTKEEFISYINKIRSIRKDISISTDLIVGFPDEDDLSFEESLDTCKKIEFTKLHVFPYSERKNTKAMLIKNHIDNKIKKDRVKIALELSRKLEEKYAKKYINKEVEVLIEQYKDGYSYGHTSNYLYVKINKQLKHNEFYNIKLIDYEYPNLIGIYEEL